jgi:aspartyl aminopeptidase
MQRALTDTLPAQLHRLDFINASWTPYHAVEEASQRLMAAGFKHIAEKDAWDLQPGVRGC